MRGVGLALGAVSVLAVAGLASNASGSRAWTHDQHERFGGRFRRAPVPAGYTRFALPFVRGYALEQRVSPEGRSEVGTGLYHVTTNLPMVLADRDAAHPLGRLRSRRELRAMGRAGVGLGGGGRDAAPDLVSVGLTLDGALWVLQGMRLMARAVHAQVEPDEAMDQMLDLTSSTMDILESAMDWMSDTEDEDAETLQAAHGFELENKANERDVRNARKRGGNPGHVLYESLATYEETLVNTLAEWISNGWISDDENTCSAPVGFTERAEKFARVRVEDIGLLQVAGRRDAKPDHVGSECELRFKPEDLAVIGVWVPK